MSPAFIQIAMSRADTVEVVDLLTEMERLARDLWEFESTFEERINANKALRGDKPSQLGKKRREELKDYEKDAAEIDSELTQDLALMESPEEIIRVLHPGLQQDVCFWEQAHKHTHSADVPIVMEFLQMKRRLLDAMAMFLARYRQHES